MFFVIWLVVEECVEKYKVCCGVQLWCIEPILSLLLLLEREREESDLDLLPRRRSSNIGGNICQIFETVECSCDRTDGWGG